MSSYRESSSKFSANGTQRKTARINKNPSYQARSTSFNALAGGYGELLVGEAGIEFYNEKNERHFIQIPWDEVNNVSASVMFGRRIVRFSVNTQRDGSFSFSARDNKAALRAVRDVIGDERVVREQTLLDLIKKRFVH